MSTDFLRASKFYVELDGEEQAGLRIISFRVRHALMEHSHLDMELRDIQGLQVDADLLLGKEIRIINNAADADIPLFEGYVIQVDRTYARGGVHSARVVGAGASIALADASGVRTFRNMTAGDIVSEICSAQSVDVQFETQGSQSTVSLTAHQVEENDYEFMLRILDENECVLNACEKTLRVIDAFDSSDTIALDYSTKGSLIEFTVRSATRPLAFAGHFHDVAQNATTQLDPQKDKISPDGYSADFDLAAERSDSVFAQPLRLDHNARTVSSKKKTDHLKRESRRSHRWLVRGEGVTTVPKIRPGKTVSIDLGSGAETLGVVESTHVFDGSVYRTSFAVVAADQFDLLAPVPRRRFPGCTTAKVTDNNNPDLAGRVQVEFRWGETSDWLRVATLYAGPSRGAYFLPEIGDEVIVGFLDGDPEQGIVLGSTWNGREKPPDDIDHPDNHVKIIRTRGGSQIKIVDEEGKETIELQTTDQKCVVSMSNDGDPTINVEAESDIVMKAVGGSVMVEAEDGDIALKCKNFNLEASDGAELQVGGLKVASDAEVEMEAGSDLKMKGGSAASLEGLNTEVKGSASLKVEGGSMADVKAGGKLTIQGALVMIN